MIHRCPYCQPLKKEVKEMNATEVWRLTDQELAKVDAVGGNIGEAQKAKREAWFAANPRRGMTLQEAKTEAHRKALDSLAKYKFMMFGYHAAVWVTLNKLDVNNERNPFTSLVKWAKKLEELRGYSNECNRRNH